MYNPLISRSFSEITIGLLSKFILSQSILCMCKGKGKGKAVPLQAWSGLKAPRLRDNGTGFW